MLVGFVLIAAFQEPLVLRLFGIHLVTDATWFAATALQVMLCYQLPVTRRTATNVLGVLLVSTGLAVVVALVPGIVDQVRVARWDGPGRAWAALNFVTANFALGLAMGTVRVQRNAWTMAYVIVQSVFAIAVATRVQAEGWLWPQAFASIAAILAALALTPQPVARAK